MFPTNYFLKLFLKIADNKSFSLKFMETNDFNSTPGFFANEKQNSIARNIFINHKRKILRNSTKEFEELEDEIRVGIIEISKIFKDVTKLKFNVLTCLEQFQRKTRRFKTTAQCI